MEDQEKLHSSTQCADFEAFKTKVYEEILKNKKYFFTLSEFIFNEISADSIPPLDNESMDFRDFLNRTVQLQLEDFESKIKVLLQNFERQVL